MAKKGLNMFFTRDQVKRRAMEQHDSFPLTVRGDVIFKLIMYSVSSKNVF